MDLKGKVRHVFLFLCRATWIGALFTEVKARRQSTYNDVESFDADRQRDFKYVKELCKDIMSPVFNTANDGTDDSMYKNFTLGATPAWVANNLCAFIWGKLQAGSKGLKRNYGKEVEASRQLILSYLEYLGIPVDDAIKVSAEESMETRMA